MPNQFPHLDITHKSRRSQQENLARGIRPGGSSSPAESVTEATEAPIALNFARMSIETAVQFYENKALESLDVRPLFLHTAVWLKELLSVRQQNRELSARLKAYESGESPDKDIDAEMREDDISE